MFSTFGNIFRIPELRKRILFTLAMVIVYQLGAHIPVPGVDAVALQKHMEDAAAQGTLLGFIDMFSGGGFKRLSVFALGIMPYISASIILQLLTVVSPYLERLSKEGEEGRKKITQYTRYGTVVITAFQSFMLTYWILSMDVVPNPGIAIPLGFGKFIYGFQFMTVLTVTSGTVFLMWLGEQITERGIGNGISILITIGIIVRLPTAIIYTINDIVQGGGNMNAFKAIVVLALLLASMAFIVVLQYAQRRIPIKRGKQVVGRKQYAANVSYLPIKINTAGVIPVIFASAILMFPATIAQFTGLEFLDKFSYALSPGGVINILLNVILIVFFCYFYTAITFNPKDTAENLQKYGATIPGYSHGKRTEHYIDRILTRVTLAGALGLAIIAVFPDIVYRYLNVPYNVAAFLGGTSLIIVVGVALETVNQIENHLRIRNYDGFRKRGRVKKTRF